MFPTWKCNIKWNEDESQIQGISWQTCNEVRKSVIYIHQTVCTGIGHSSKGVSLQLFPWWLVNVDVIVLHPALVCMVIDVGPVMPRWSLAFMYEHSVESVGNLRAELGCSLKCISIIQFRDNETAGGTWQSLLSEYMLSSIWLSLSMLAFNSGNSRQKKKRFQCCQAVRWLGNNWEGQ